MKAIISDRDGGFYRLKKDLYRLFAVVITRLKTGHPARELCYAAMPSWLVHLAMIIEIGKSTKAKYLKKPATDFSEVATSWPLEQHEHSAARRVALNKDYFGITTSFCI